MTLVTICLFVGLLQKKNPPYLFIYPNALKRPPALNFISLLNELNPKTNTESKTIYKTYTYLQNKHGN